MIEDIITAADVAELRSMAGEMLGDSTCKITDPATEVRGPLDEDTGLYEVTTPAETVYEDVCRIRPPEQGESAAAESESGEHEWTYQNSVLQLPVTTSTAVRVGHELEVLTSDYDADLVGRKFLLESIQHGTHTVVRRFRLKEVTG